jgi:hypothetical protein
VKLAAYPDSRATLAGVCVAPAPIFPSPLRSCCRSVAGYRDHQIQVHSLAQN